MSQAPTPTETARGYQQASLTQFSVFLPNRVGKLHELVHGFDENLCRICAMAVHEASDHAVVRIVPNNTVGGRKILQDQELTFIESEVLAVAIDPGHSLSAVCEHLLRAELSIRFAYPLFGWPAGPTAMVLAVDDLTLASQILRRKEYRLLGEADLPKYAD
jgi:hypothetical protein